MEETILLFDIAIASLSIWILIKLKGYGGIIGNALNLIGYGTITVGVSQFFETAGLYLISTQDMSVVEIVHLSHHIILFVGMSLVFLGFEKLMNKS